MIHCIGDKHRLNICDITSHFPLISSPLLFNLINGKADKDQEEKHCRMLNLQMKISYVQADIQASACFLEYLYYSAIIEPSCS